MKMSIMEKNDCLIDFSGDINARLCTLVKLTKAESAYVANAIRTLDKSRHRKAVVRQIVLS